MFNIAQYLNKFKNLGLEERLLKEAISSSIKEALNLDLIVKNILIKNNEAIIDASPAIKNAIFMKKRIILDKVKEKDVGLVENIR